MAKVIDPLANQKAAIAMLLTSPSTLHDAFKRGDKTDTEDQLNKLNFSPSARAIADNAIDKRGHLDTNALERVANFLKLEVWGGEEPHPDDQPAKVMVSMARLLDGER